MTGAAVRKYNPGFLTDDELVGSFCVRTHEFESLMEMLRECTGSANAHQIVIGPRGSGKTTLLLRIATEVRRIPALSRRFFPIVFAEESYEVASPGEFWLECLSRLVTQSRHSDDHLDLSRTLEELRTIREDRPLGDRCLAALLDFADQQNKRLVLVVENLNMMFQDMADPDAGWRLRHTLQTESRIVMLASATSRFDEIDNPEHALYDQFRVLLLRPLDTTECAALWETVSGRSPVPKTIRSLEILTGGSPRLLTIVARFGAGLSFRDLMGDLLNLVDDHTEYFKSHIESLPPQERRVYLALADLWKPATTREVADRSRLETSKCSAQLARLIERGVVQVEGGTARRKQYYLTERLYNIYYLLRRSRRPDRLIEALICFMASYYSPRELREFGACIVREAGSLDTEIHSLHQGAFARLMELPVLAGYREDLLVMMSGGFSEMSYSDWALPDAATTKSIGVGPDHRWPDQLHGSMDEHAELVAARALFSKAVTLKEQNRSEETLAAVGEVVRRFGESETLAVLELVANALLDKGVTLYELNRTEEELAAYDELVRRFGESEAPGFFEPVAKALVNKGVILGELNRLEEALDACAEVVRRFGESDVTGLRDQVALALYHNGFRLRQLNRLEEALTAFGEVERRFGNNETPLLLELVAEALSYKGVTLGQLNRPEEELAAYDEVERRFGNSETPLLLELVAKTLVNKGYALGRLNRPEEALTACEEVVHRFAESDAPVLFDPVARALVGKGLALRDLDRAQEALAAYDDVVRRFAESETPAVLDQIAMALLSKGNILRRLNRPEEALAAYEEVVHRFRESDAPTVLRLVARALVNKGSTLGELNRPEEALAACEEMVRRFGENETPALLELVARALGLKGVMLCLLNQPEKALVAYEEVVHRFDESESPALRELTALALVSRAALELEGRQYEVAIETVGRALDDRRMESPKNRCWGHVIRAKAIFASGDPFACEQDIEAMLATLPDLDSLPRENLEALMAFCIDLGPARMRELIKASPSADLLLPLTTALERELGLEPRVAREVEEVAQDIRRDLVKLKDTQIDAVE